MKKSRLTNIFKALTKKEIRDLRKWLHSPAHNQREDTVLLFEYLVAEDNLQQEDLLDKSKVFLHLFPQHEQYDDAKIRQVMYFLLKSTEEFLIYEEFKKDEIKQKILLVRTFGEKRLDKFFRKEIDSTTQKQEKLQLRNRRFFQNKYELQYENYDYLSKAKRSSDYDLKEFSDALDIYYICAKLQQGCVMASHQRVVKREYDKGLLEDVLLYIQRKELMTIPIIGAYFYGYKSIAEQQNEENYSKLKNILFQNEELFSKDELCELYLIAINSCIGKINKGEMSYLRETFELYRRGFENKSLLLENRITVFTFNNVVLIALRIEEFVWAENFIENYSQYLKSDSKESTVLYCEARLAFAKGDFDQAMSLFIQVEHTDVLLNLTAKTFLLKMYYEQSEFKVLDSLLDSMRTYVRRKKVVGYHKENYQNIIKYTKKLVRINPFSKTDKAKLKTEVEKINPLTERTWILEQLSKV